MGDNEQPKQHVQLPQLIITVKPDGGGVNVSGPIADRILSYGMIESAKEAIAEWHRKQRENASPIVPVHTLPPALG